MNPLYSESQGYAKVDPIVLKFTEAVCYEFKKQLPDAIDTWKDLLPMTGNSKDSQKHVADLIKQARRQAEQRRKKPPPYDPAEVQALVSKGISQYDDGDLEGAKASFGRAMELNPQSFEATQNMGFCLEAAGDLNGALAKYQAGTLILPKYDGAVYNLAYVLEKLNLPGDAGMMYQKFHELAGKYPYDPKHIVALQQGQARERARQEQIRKRGY